MGVTTEEYWTVQFIWDWCKYLVMMGVGAIIIFAFNSKFANASSMVFLLFGFPFANFPVMYAISFLFNDPEVALLIANAPFQLYFMVSFMVYGALKLPLVSSALNLSQTVWNLIQTLVLLTPVSSTAVGLRAVLLCQGNATRNLWALPNADGVDYDTAFMPLVSLIIQGLVGFIIVLSIDGKLNLGFLKDNILTPCYGLVCRCTCMSFCYGAEPEREWEQYGRAEVEDDDVTRERKEVEQNIGTQEAAILMRELKVQYPPTGNQRFEGNVAVQELSLRVKKNECFALLGTNGAGKSSTLSVLMKQTTASEGQVLIEGRDVYSLTSDTCRGFGYCPQANALFDVFSTIEMMQYFAELRGVVSLERSERQPCLM